MKARTSSTPCRSMLPVLFGKMSSVTFEIGVRGGDNQLIEAIADECANVSVLPLKRSRKWDNVLCLLGLPYCTDVPDGYDLYLRFDVGRLGRAKAIIALVADLSAYSGEASMPWHGRVMFRRKLQDTLRSEAEVVAISEFTRSALLQQFDIRAERVRVIPNGLNSQWFDQPGDERETDRPFWIWYGAVTPRKNLEGLIEAYAGVINNDPPGLLIVTETADHSIVRKIAYAYGVGDAVECRAAQPLPELIRQVDRSSGLVFPSFVEGFGMPIAEVMARGRPVLTGDCSAMPEVAGGHAELCDPKSVSSIADGLLALKRSGYTEADCQARQAWAEKFRVGAMADKYKDLILRLTGERDATEY